MIEVKISVEDSSRIWELLTEKGIPVTKDGQVPYGKLVHFFKPEDKGAVIWQWIT